MAIHTYYQYLYQDYPSISQIASKVADNRINVIFAVTKDQTQRYKALSDIISGSVTGELASDSSNIVDLVRGNYEVIYNPIYIVDTRYLCVRESD